MSNIKDVRIHARLPYDWTHELPESEAALFTGLLLSPLTGFTIDQRRVDSEPSEHGGWTAMYFVAIEGQEGVSFSFLDRIATALAHIEGGTVLEAWARDIEDGGDWCELSLNAVPPKKCYRCKSEVSQPRPKLSEQGRFMTPLKSWAFEHAPDCPVRKKILADPRVEAMQPRLTFHTREIAPGISETRVIEAE